MTRRKGRAVVLLSGGLDSATTLAIAQSRHRECHTLAVAYGQRHVAELAAARRVARRCAVTSHRVIDVGLRRVGGSALTDRRIAVPERPSRGIPVTYVPARNTLLLSLALGLGEVLRAPNLYIGVNAVDYSGYPDCRPAFIRAFRRVANLATRAGSTGRTRFEVQTPLIRWSKARIIREGLSRGVAFELTVSCYAADRRGRACGRCDACRIRRRGFQDAGIADPTRYKPGAD